MQRAYSILETKSVEQRDDVIRIRGIASTPTPDSSLDIVEPMGAKFKTPMPLLWQHNHEKPVGSVTFAKPTEKGIPFEAELPIVTEPGLLKDRIDEATQSLKYGLVSAVSIGFSAAHDKIERLKSGGLRYLEWSWRELSLVTIPANSEAVLTAIKSADAAALASAGEPRDDVAPAAAEAVQPKRGPVYLKKEITRTPQFIKVNIGKKQ